MSNNNSNTAAENRFEVNWDSSTIDKLRRAATAAFSAPAFEEIPAILGYNGNISPAENSVIQSLRRAIQNEVIDGTVSIVESSGCTSIEELLELFLKRAALFQCVRYYRFAGSDSEFRMISVGAAGMSQEAINLMTTGELIRYRVSSEPVRAESFWVHDLQVPILFQVNPGSLNQHRPIFCDKLIPFIEIPNDHCESLLAGKKSDSWVDIPLVANGKLVGKLSCDIPRNNIGQLTSGEAVRITALASCIAPSLEFLRPAQDDTNECRHRIAPALDDLDKCETLEDLFHFCVNVLPKKYFDADFASIFTLSVDDNEPASRLLILQKTSYPLRYWEEKTAYYDLDDKVGLTAWVANSHKPLRLHDLDRNSAGFESQLSAYADDDGYSPCWTGRFRDSDTTRSFLAVPIITGKNKLLGVLRITERRNGEKFSEADQERLISIATLAIAPRFRELVQFQTENKQQSVLDRVTTIVTSFSNFGGTQYRDVFVDGMETLFPQANAPKLFLCNRFNDHSRQTFSHWVMGGKLAPEERCDGPYESFGSLTAFTVRAGRGIFINNMQRACNSGILLPICKGPRCAIAAPIRHIDRIYGIVVVKSQMYDIIPERDLPRIEFLGQQMGLAESLRNSQ